MGFVNSFKGLIGMKESTPADRMLVDGVKPHALIRDLKRVDYVTEELSEVLPDAVRHITQDADLSTVFICGGYAAFAAHMTCKYTDIDFFCTSQITFNNMIRKIHDRDYKSPYVVAGTVDGIKVNVIHNPNASTIEDIMDEFDMTWCRVGIDLEENTVISHPEADSFLPIWDRGRLVNKSISKNNLADRLFERYCKWKDRRIKTCLTNDGQIQELLGSVVHSVKPDEVSEKSFDLSY